MVLLVVDTQKGIVDERLYAFEKFATDRAVSVVYSRDSIGISKINAAFLTGQQIDRIHVQQLLLKCFERDACWTSLSIK